MKIGQKTGKLSSCLNSLLLRYHQYLSDPDIFSFFPIHVGVIWYFGVIRWIRWNYLMVSSFTLWAIYSDFALNHCSVNSALWSFWCNGAVIQQVLLLRYIKTVSIHIWYTVAFQWITLIFRHIIKLGGLLNMFIGCLYSWKNWKKIKKYILHFCQKSFIKWPFLREIPILDYMNIR